MTTYATWDDLVLNYEASLPVEARPRMESLVRQASAKLTALVPSLPARLAAGSVDAELPRGLVVEAVLRVYRNPAGVSQQSTGPFSRSLHKDAARAEIFFDPEVVRALLAPDGERSAGVGTFQIGIPAPVRPTSGLDGAVRYPYPPEMSEGVL
jgi:hypothetical protein